MKKTGQILTVLLLLFAACEGSDTYRGKWKATDEKGNRFEINFSPKSFSIDDKKDDSSISYEYSQNSINIENGVKTYGIRLEDGRSYQIHFPVANDESRGVIADEGGNVIYTISRKNYLMYGDIHKLK